jgi:LysM repeat protein
MKAFFRFRSLGSIVGILGLFVASSLISSCTSGGGDTADTGYGPFDSRGNYVEAWADNPSKWTRRTFSKDASPDADDATLLAANDSPPANMTPITNSTSTRTAESSRVSPDTTSSNSSKPRTGATGSSNSTKPKNSATVASGSTKPKTTASKSRTTRVLVKKGDTLSALAMRHGSSVGAIQRANGMRDTKLSIGRSLVIPRL